MEKSGAPAGFVLPFSPRFAVNIIQLPLPFLIMRSRLEEKHNCVAHNNAAHCAGAPQTMEAGGPGPRDPPGSSAEASQSSQVWKVLTMYSTLITVRGRRRRRSIWEGDRQCNNMQYHCTTQEFILTQCGEPVDVECSIRPSFINAADGALLYNFVRLEPSTISLFLLVRSGHVGEFR